MTDGRKVNANLMGSPGLEPALDEARAVEPLGSVSFCMPLCPKMPTTSVWATRAVTEGARMRATFLRAAPLTPSIGRTASSGLNASSDFCRFNCIAGENAAAEPPKELA